MKKTTSIAFALVAVFSISEALAQKYVTKNGSVKFYSETPVETIEAHNNQVNSALDITKGDFVFKILIKSFEFPKALMQEHFNENYMESDKFPAATFVGKVDNMDAIKVGTDGKYTAKVSGKMTIHGVTKDVTEEGTFTVKGNTITGHAVFKVKVADYDIKIAKAVTENIAEEVEVTVDVNLNKM